VSVYPVFLKLAGRRVLVVGGGPVAAGKVNGLLEAGAEITVVAPRVVPAIEKAAVDVRRRGFEPGDLDGVCFVVAAAPPEVNRAVAAAAHVRGLLVNAVDDVENASAYLGAVFHRAGVTVALSTDGAAPALAGLLREALEEVLPADLDAWMACARDARQRWLAEGVPIAERRPLLLEALVKLYERRADASMVTR
jgi:uroporphyrin-III C-methyltransferase/precorrin-2 dehydrogenase/sirohydrochlorin ferrochelatase